MKSRKRITEMIRSFKYPLNPTKRQERTLLAWLEITRDVYNEGLAARRTNWNNFNKNTNLYDQYNVLTIDRENNPQDYQSNPPVVVLRGALKWLQTSYNGAFNRIKASKKTGFPRFKSKSRWNTLMFVDDVSNHPLCAGDKRVKIPNLGKIKLKLTRPLLGTPKEMLITRNRDGKWFIIFHCVDVPRIILPKTHKSVGIDLGVINLVATSDGKLYRNPKILKECKLELERAHRSLSKKKKGSIRFNETKTKLRRIYERIANLRRERSIQLANKLVKRNDIIYLEDLKIANMVRNPGLAKSINDASWSTLIHWLQVKAEEAGRELIFVDPKNTSQVCSNCLQFPEIKKTLAVRTHSCNHCGYEEDRDVNAAKNVFRLGMSLRRGTLQKKIPMTRKVLLNPSL